MSHNVNKSKGSEYFCKALWVLIFFWQRSLRQYCVLMYFLYPLRLFPGRCFLKRPLFHRFIQKSKPLLMPTFLNLTPNLICSYKHHVGAHGSFYMEMCKSNSKLISDTYSNRIVHINTVIEKTGTLPCQNKNCSTETCHTDICHTHVKQGHPAQHTLHLGARGCPVQRPSATERCGTSLNKRARADGKSQRSQPSQQHIIPARAAFTKRNGEERKKKGSAFSAAWQGC